MATAQAKQYTVGGETFGSLNETEASLFDSIPTQQKDSTDTETALLRAKFEANRGDSEMRKRVLRAARRLRESRDVALAESIAERRGMPKELASSIRPYRTDPEKGFVSTYGDAGFMSPQNLFTVTPEGKQETSREGLIRKINEYKDKPRTVADGYVDVGGDSMRRFREVGQTADTDFRREFMARRPGFDFADEYEETKETVWREFKPNKFGWVRPHSHIQLRYLHLPVDTPVGEIKFPRKLAERLPELFGVSQNFVRHANVHQREHPGGVGGWRMIHYDDAGKEMVRKMAGNPMAYRGVLADTSYVWGGALPPRTLAEEGLSPEDVVTRTYRGKFNVWRKTGRKLAKFTEQELGLRKYHRDRAHAAKLGPEALKRFDDESIRLERYYERLKKHFGL